mgnify:CR=1 FL=1
MDAIARVVAQGKEILLDQEGIWHCAADPRIAKLLNSTQDTKATEHDHPAYGPFGSFDAKNAAELLGGTWEMLVEEEFDSKAIY